MTDNERMADNAPTTDRVPTTDKAPSTDRVPTTDKARTADGERGHRPGTRGLLERVADRLTQSENEIEAIELREDTGRLGGTPIAVLADRQLAAVCGAVRSVTLRPRAQVPALVVEVYDGSRALNLIWLGRREIRGIEPGTYLRARGRVTYQDGTPTIFNPAYEIKPDRGR